MDRDNSEYIYIIKGVAIFTVICAHTATITSDQNLIVLMSQILNNLGSLGVPIFYIFAGYFYLNNSQKFIELLKKKIINVFIPWIFTGSLIYLYVYLRKGNISFSELIFWLIGYKTYLYFLTNLLFFYMYFFYFKKSEKIILITMMLGVISLNMSAIGLMNNDLLYLNPFNFIIYFGFGLILNRKIRIEDLKKFTNKFKIIAFVLYIFINIYLEVKNIKSGYFSKNTLILQGLSIIFILGFCQNKILKNEYILDIGKKSFSIYLLHMPLAGLITYLFNKVLILNSLVILRPFLVLYLTKVSVDIYIKIFEKTKFKIIFYKLIGI